MTTETPSGGNDPQAATRLRRLTRPPASTGRVSQAERQAMCPDARFHVPPADACGFPGCGWTADAPAVDPPGTCHLVGCPDKGRHAPHLIGCPETFEPYERPSTLPQHAFVLEQDVALVIDLVEQLGVLTSADAQRYGPLLHRLQRALATARNDRSI